MATYSSKKYPAGSITSATLADGSVAAVDLAEGSVGTNQLADSAVTVGKLAATLDLTGKSITLPAGVGGHVTGTEANRPASPAVGTIYFNTDEDTLQQYTSTGWQNIANDPPAIASITGNIYNTVETSLVLAGTAFGAAATVRFSYSGATTDVNVTPDSDLQITVTVPSAVYNQSGGTVVTISVISAGKVSNGSSKTVFAVPTGGTITTTGSTRIHRFNTGTSTFNTQGLSLTADVLMVAGGGGGGTGNGTVGGEGSGGGGGGAGGLVFWDDLSISPGSYTMVVGAGGTAAPNEGAIGTNGGNTTCFGYTALGGGGAASHETTQRSNAGGSGGGNHDRNNDSGRAPGIQFSTYGYGFGNDGGLGFGLDSGDTFECGAGGGGAGARGGDANQGNTPNVAGDGGIGRDYSSVFGTSYGDSGWFAGGGGGGGGTPGQADDFGVGGQGGGGRGGAGSTPAAQGVDGTGGGGGGGQGTSPGGPIGADGGDGIILVKYTLS